MHKDASQKTELEQHPEQEHADEPAVRLTKRALVLMAVTKRSVSTKHRSANKPASRMEKDVLHPSYGEKVGDGATDMEVYPFWDT